MASKKNGKKTHVIPPRKVPRLPDVEPTSGKEFREAETKRREYARLNVERLTIYIEGTSSKITFSDEKKMANFCERMTATGVKFSVGAEPEAEEPATDETEIKTEGDPDASD